MAEFTKGAIIALIGGAIAVIAAFLPWWTINLPYYIVNIKFHLSPLLGLRQIGFPYYLFPPSTYSPLLIVGGLLALAGGALGALTIVKKPLGIVGGCVALGGVVLFIIIKAITPFDMGMLQIEGLFGSTTFYYYVSFDLRWFLTYGSFVACAGGVLAIVGAAMHSEL